MIGKNVRYGFSIRLAALALTILGLTQFNLRAQVPKLLGAAAAASSSELPTETVALNIGKISFAHGQTLRLNLTYAVDAAQASQPASAIRAFARFKDTSGNTVYVSTAGGGVWKTLNGGQSWSFEVNRDLLGLAGDPRTGALALVPELVIEAPAGVGADLPASLEITDNQTGKVEFHQQGKYLTPRIRPEDGGRQGFVFGLRSVPAPISVSREQTPRVNLTHLLPPLLANRRLSGQCVITFYDLNGIAQATYDAVIAHGQTLFRSEPRSIESGRRSRHGAHAAARGNSVSAPARRGVWRASPGARRAATTSGFNRTRRQQHREIESGLGELGSLVHTLGRLR